MDFLVCSLGLLAEGCSETSAKFSLLQLLYIGGYINLRENCNNSTQPPPFGRAYSASWGKSCGCFAFCLARLVEVVMWQGWYVKKQLLGFWIKV